MARRRWRTMPWLEVLFGLMIAPLGITSIFFIVIQPIVIGTWSTIALITAAVLSAVIGLWLVFTRLTLGSEGGMALSFRRGPIWQYFGSWQRLIV